MLEHQEHRFDWICIVCTLEACNEGIPVENHEASVDTAHIDSAQRLAAIFLDAGIRGALEDCVPLVPVVPLVVVRLLHLQALPVDR